MGLSFIHLFVVWSQYDPATEAVAEVNDGHAEAEANHIGKRSAKCDDQDLCEAQRQWTDQRAEKHCLTFPPVIKSAASNNNGS